MNKKIYKKIAKENGVTWQEVRRDMQFALTHAYEDPKRNILNVVRQGEVTKKGEIPTPEEFINYAKNKALDTQRKDKFNKDDF